MTKFTLTIKVSKPSEPPVEYGQPYDFQDLSQTQVTIIIEDIDDNPPMFETSSYVLGKKKLLVHVYVILQLVSC